MSWKEATLMSQRKEFVSLACAAGANISLLCRRFGISRKTGYKWITRCAQDGGEDWSADRSRRPHVAPARVALEVEETIVAIRKEFPFMGARKICRFLLRQGLAAPAPSTVTAVLRRRGLLAPEESKKRGPMQRFEHDGPNQLWQMDFKGPVATATTRCHPLAVVDDHSRYALGIAPCADQITGTVQAVLVAVFRRYGLPGRILCDNGTPWGSAESRYTHLGAWLIRLGVAVVHGRPYHPQTQGKTERFNRTLGLEAIAGRVVACPADWGPIFERYRHWYNHERPHEALDLEPPASRYRPSAVEYPEVLPAIEYQEGDIVRRVGPAGYISYQSARYQIGRAFSGHPVALRPSDRDGVMRVYFCHAHVATINLRLKTCEQN
jgi:transposase InsO family protein